jgi:hypothetical protein
MRSTLTLTPTAIPGRLSLATEALTCELHVSALRRIGLPSDTSREIPIRIEQEQGVVIRGAGFGGVDADALAGGAFDMQ